ncbi:MAG: aldo/keto reductase [Clostridia bacterium]|nr:aldo/keto reductase [Clostridia bacterium]
MDTYFGQSVPKLGFGLMRLPRKAGFTDIEQTKAMVDLFLAAGFTYFDTAYVYLGSEKAIKAALVDRYPRESYTLATKINAFMMAPTESAAKNQFYTSLERTGAGYFDYYLLHSFKENNYQKYDKFHLWDYVAEQKQKGLVKHMGFSFHGKPLLLEQLLTAHPEVDFIQLQLNYADWENPKVASRENYEVARRHGVSIVVMEPVKGGSLANPPKSVRELLKAYAPERSYASWAIRFAASLEGIITVLSGMSDLAQMQDNISFMKDFRPLDAQEQAVIRQAMALLRESDLIPCTACGYCTEGCPKSIRIPEIFAAVNQQRGNGQIEAAAAAYAAATADGARADDCIRCGQCERACPQGLPIIQRLSEAAALFKADK